MLADVVVKRRRHRWPVIDAAALRACADGGSVRKCARSKRRPRMPTPTRRAPMRPNMRAMIDAGHRLAAVEYQTPTERRLNSRDRRVFHDGHPVDAQRRIAAHTGNHAGSTRPGATARTGDADSTVQRVAVIPR